MSLADMRKELREIRKGTVKPISRMNKSEVMSELGKHKPAADVPVKKAKKSLEASAEPAVVVKAKKILEQASAEPAVVVKAVKKAVQKKSS